MPGLHDLRHVFRITSLTGGGRWIMAGELCKTWVLVINGVRSRILRGLSANGEDAVAELVLRSESRNLLDIMSDKPGRAVPLHGGGRRLAMEPAGDPLAEDQQEFLRHIIALLECHRRAGDFDSLAIFAGPEMLGKLRQMLPEPLRNLVIREVPKNLLHLSTQELSETVSRELKNGTDLS